MYKRQKRDKDKTDKEPLASSDDTKKFTYKDGKLTYQMTGFGVTTTMSMTRENTKPRKKYPVGIQKFIMQIMLEQIMEILPLYSLEKKES